MDRRLTHPAVAPAVLAGAAGAAMLAAWAALVGSAVWVPHHHHRPAEAGTLLAAVAMWQAMAVAMMTPTVLPWMAAYARLVAPPGRQAPGTAVAGFAGGYFVAWLGYAVVAATLQLGLQGAGLLPDGRLGQALGGAVLVGAGVFQFLPFRQACLSHCRNPLSYFLARWKDGPTGGFRLGLVHGAYCLGCCWMVMLTGFALGVMNLAWMAVLTVVIVLEQVAPFGRHLGRAFGAALVVWGVWLLFS